MPEELFITHCTTCRARLKVYDQAAIGQILGCPKCGSMVQVVPPADWKAPPAAAPPVVAPAAAKLPQKTFPSKPATAPPVAASQTASMPGVKVTPPGGPIKAPAAKAPTSTTPSSSSVSLGVPVNAGQRQAAASVVAPPQLPKGRAAAAAAAIITVTNPIVAPPAIANGSSANAAVQFPSVTASAAQSAAVVTAPPVAAPPIAGAAELSASAIAASTMPASRWGSITARLQKDWWMLAGGFVAGIIVGGSVWLVVLMGDEKPSASTDSAATDSAATVAQVNKTTEQDNATPTADAEATKHAVNKPVEAAAVDEPATLAAEQPNATAHKVELPTEPAEAPAKVETPEGAAAEETVPTAAAAATDAAVADDADLLGGQLMLPQDVPPPNRSPVAVEDDADDSEKPAAGADAKMPAESAEANAAEVTATVPASASSQQELVSERLASVLPPLDFEQVPLNRFVAFVAQSSTQTITIDRAALQKAGIDYKAPVTVKRSGTTVAQALRDALGPLGLTYRVDKDTLVITVAKRSAR